MKKVFTFLLLTFLFIININADVTMSYDKAVNNSQRYVYKFNKYGKYIITDKKYIEIVNSDTAIIPFAFKNNKSTVNTDFTRGGLLNEEEFIVSKDSNGNTYLSQDVEFFLMKDGTIKAINVLNNDVIDAGDKKYALRVTEFVIPGTKTKGSGTKNNPWEFVGTYKLTFYIENGKITNNNLLVDKYIVYAVESTEGQIVINFKPDSTFAYYNNNCDFEYEYDKTNKIHRIFKSNKDITSDKECTINLIATGLLVQYDLNGGTGNCESLSVTKGSKLTNICTSVSKPGYMFKGWKDASGNIVTKDTIVNDNLKLTAQWEIKKYTLTVKPNGGVWNNQTENKTIEQEYMSTTTIDNPTKGSTYKITFDSNNTNATISKNIVEAERPFNNWKLTKDVNDVTTKLENNKFTFGTSNATIEANYRVNSNNTTLALISKTGHICKWNTKSDGSGTSYTSGYTNYSANSNITLYAICSANSYKVSLDNQGATTAGTSSVSVTYGKNISNITVPAKAYKVTLVYDSTKTEEKTVKLTFGGYYSETNGKGIQYINASGSGVKAYDKASNTTLYAKWNSASITLPTPSKTGYTFDGWYTQSSGGTKVSNTYTPAGNVTLYAHWTNVNYTLTINPNGGIWNNTTSNSTKTGTTNSTLSIANPTPPKGYTVSFNTNGGSSLSSITSTKSFSGWSNSGSGSISGTTYTFGAGNGTLTANYKNNSVNLPTPTKLGYTFGGWYTASSGGTKVNNTYTPTGNITLYAHWSANSYTYSYTLSFDANGCGTLRVSYVTATVGKTYGDADDGDGLPSIALTTGKNFDGWYTSSSGGNKITNSTTVTASSDNGTLYAHCSYINYNINYNLANGTHGSSHPTSAKYGDVINISKPSKKVTINLSRGTNASNATISSTSVSAAQTFAGWTATNLNTTTARRGTSSSSVNTQWSSGSTKSTYTYYKNLTVTNNATVKLTANWTQKSVTLPTITKSGYKCGWATSSTATTYTYESGATYVPNANGSSNITLYGVCKRIAPPSLTVKFTTSAGYTNTCTDTYTTSHGSCTFNDGYYAPLSLSIVATDTNEVTNMKLEYNATGQTSYTDIIGSYKLSFTKSGNTYTAKTSIGSTGKRKLRITATNNQGKTGTVILNINIIPQTFAAQNNCTDKTITAAGNIFVWKGESSCTNASKSPCGQMQADTLGLISKGAELCYVKTISSSSNVIFIAAWIEESRFSHKGGVLTKGYPGYGTATTKTFNGKTYYYSKLTAWCKNASCGGGWVIKPEI